MDEKLLIQKPSNHEGIEEQLKYMPGVGRSIAWLILFTLLFYGAVFIFGGAYGFYLGMNDPQLALNVGEIEQLTLDAILSPFGMSATFYIQSVLLIPFIIWASNFSQQSWRETLAFRPVAWSVLGFWLLVYVGYLVIQTLVELVFPIEHNEFIKSLAGSKHFGLAVGMIVIAPVIEELVFRGYLYKAWRHTRLGLWGTLIVTSLLFTAVHMAQYSGMILVYVFALSILLGLAREKSGSIWPPLVIHSMNNLIAVVTLVYLGIV